MARKLEFLTEQTRASGSKFFRETARREAASLNVSQDGAWCRWLRQISKATKVESKRFLFICNRLRRGAESEILGMKCAMYRTRPTAGVP
jgi:hypothetical protein